MFDTVGGRYVVFRFLATADDDAGLHGFSYVLIKHRKNFDDDKVAFSGVSLDPADHKSGDKSGLG